MKWLNSFFFHISSYIYKIYIFILGIFGGVIQDQKLTRKGIIHETEALLICIGKTIFKVASQ